MVAIEMIVYYFFKIFNNIKSNHESEILAKLELEGLLGNVEEIRNVTDICMTSPFSLFNDETVRIQDILTNELPYGRIHGYFTTRDTLEDITAMISRLSYTKEIFIILQLSNQTVNELLSIIIPLTTQDKNLRYYIQKKHVLFHIITNQYYLEKSQYISKLSRDENEVDNNFETLSKHLFINQYRIPASSTMAVGKRLVDYFAIREEPSLYLNHYMHPYKGKFHPKMVRALINYVYPKNKGIILDNFSGSGTTLVESGFMGLESFGVEINPLSALMCNVKTNSLKIRANVLKQEFETLLEELKKEYQNFKFLSTGQSTLMGFMPSEGEDKKEKIKLDNISVEALEKSKLLKGPLKVDIKKIEEILIARNIIEKLDNKLIKEFFLLSLSGTISDMNRRTRKSFLEAFEERTRDLYLRIYLFEKLNDLLKIEIPNSFTFISDTRDMKELKDDSVDAIVNSPPYSTALDYIRNDEPQLILLNLVKSFEDLERNMMGNPRVNFDRNELTKMIETDNNLVFNSSPEGKRFVKLLIDNNRADAGLRVFKFFMDMYFSLKEMFRVQKKGSKCAIVIGNNHFKIDDHFQEIANDLVLEELGVSLGYEKDRIIYRELQKSSSGNIRKESIIILKKPD